MNRSMRFTSMSILSAVVIAACAHRFGSPTSPGLRLSTNPDVRWETEGPHDLALVLENTGTAPTAIPEPSPARAYVTVYDTDPSRPVCTHGPDPAAPTTLADLGPGERRALVVHLPSCELSRGEYRYEVWYDIPDVPGTRWSGRIGPEYGRIFVQSSAAAVDFPASRSAVSPPERADAPAPPAPPAPANPHFHPAFPPFGPASLACVDRELERRGLNAWGDPSATVYPDGPPTLPSDVERQQMVLERYPDIAMVCRLPP
jgi:hypothetical protein